LDDKDAREVVEKELKIDPNTLSFEDEHGKVEIAKGDFKKFEIANGDVLVLKQREGLTTDMLERLGNKMGAMGLNRTIVVVVDKLSDIKSLNEEQMRKHGWVRYEPSG
jgi:hypothetical protein